MNKRQKPTGTYLSTDKSKQTSSQLDYVIDRQFYEFPLSSSTPFLIGINNIKMFCLVETGTGML
jgi:hypothetical protein